MSTVQQLANNLLLTNTAAASTYTANTNGLLNHTLYIMYSPDTDSTNALNITIECSIDGTNWHPYGSPHALTGSVSETAQATFAFTSDGTTDQYETPISFTVQAKEIRIKAVETNTPADYGNYSAWLYSRA